RRERGAFRPGGRGTAHGRDHGRQRQGDLQAGKRRSAEELERARHQDRGLEIFLWRHRERDGPAQRRPGNFGAPTGPSSHADRDGLGNRGRLFRERRGGGYFLRRTDLALREPARRVQFAGLVQRRAASTERQRSRRRARELYLQPHYWAGGARGDTIRISPGQRLFHPERRGHDGRHHAVGDERSDALQVRQRNRERSFVVAEHAREIERGWETERAAVVPESLRPGGERSEERRQTPAGGEDEHAQGLAPGHRRVQ